MHAKRVGGYRERARNGAASPPPAGERVIPGICTVMCFFALLWCHGRKTINLLRINNNLVD
jgi:hypothetical protein